MVIHSADRVLHPESQPPIVTSCAGLSRAASFMAEFLEGGFFSGFRLPEHVFLVR